jgi:nitrogen regulatory protein PII
MKDLYWLITITQRQNTTEYEEFYLSHGVRVSYSMPCSGTAHEKTLALLGIERTEKSVLFSAVPGENLSELMRRLTVEMKIDLPDRGIAVAIPFSGVGGMRTYEFFRGSGQAPEKKEDDGMQSGYELIVAIYEKGYTDKVMDAAREAGAGGGTTIRAKGTAAGAEKFFGISIAEEKDLLLIVSTSEKKKDIMKAIIQQAGPETDANALIFSLPVSETAGFRFADTVNKDEE